MTLLELCEWLEGTAPAIFARESLYGFQLLVGFHLMGLVFSVGALLWLDLRMTGIALKGTRVSDLNRELAPWFIGGFIVMFGSGLVLFAGFATSAYGNTFFRIKLVAIALAGINALVFHFMTGRGTPAWDAAPLPPASVRLAGFGSLALWAIIIVSGRMMSYTMF